MPKYKPHHDKLSARDKRDHFFHECGIVRQNTASSNNDLYRQNYDAIFNKSAREDTANDSDKEAERHTDS